MFPYVSYSRHVDNRGQNPGHRIIKGNRQHSYYLLDTLCNIHHTNDIKHTRGSFLYLYFTLPGPGRLE